MIGINPRWLHRQPHVPDVAPCRHCGLAEVHRPNCWRAEYESATSAGPMEADPWEGPSACLPLCLYRVDGELHYGFATALHEGDELELIPDAGGEPIRRPAGECEYVDMVA